jgi:hypothetical protein
LGSLILVIGAIGFWFGFGFVPLNEGGLGVLKGFDSVILLFLFLILRSV